MTAHTRDTDCDVDPATDSCRTCSVDHSGECGRCKGRGYHVTGCPEIDDFHVSVMRPPYVPELGGLTTHPQATEAYDYRRQCWLVRDGDAWRVAACGHIQPGPCCYAREHEGERVENHEDIH